MSSCRHPGRARAVVRAAHSAVSLLCESFKPESSRPARLNPRDFEQLETRILFATDLQLTPLHPFGSRVYGNTALDSITFTGEVDEFSVVVAGGQKLAVQVAPAGGAALRPRIEIVSDADSSVVADITAPANGSPVVVQPTSVPAGTYILRVHAASSASGQYKLTAQLNAAFEIEAVNGTSNDTTATAEPLSPSTTVQNGGTVSSVTGIGGPGDDYYKYTLTAGDWSSILLDTPAEGGPGQFGARDDEQTIQNASLVKTGDLNDDGLADIVVASTDTSYFGAHLSVMLNNGDGTFNRIDYDPYYFAASDMVVADFDGDGKDDVALVSAGWSDEYNPSSPDELGQLTILSSDGNGGFFWSNRNVSSSPASIVAGDFNDDGSIDLALGGFADQNNPGGGAVTFFVNDGSGGFTEDATFSTPQNIFSLATGDFNGDDVPDLVIGEGNFAVSPAGGAPASEQGLLEIVRTDAFDLSTANRINTFDFDHPVLRTATGDIDHDGNLDTSELLYGGDSPQFNAQLLDSDGNPTLSYGQNIGGNDGALNGAGFTLADVNRDGWVDVVLTRGDSFPTDVVEIGINTHDGFFNIQTNASVQSDARGIALADLNGDGDLELISTSDQYNDDGDGPYGYVSILEGRGDVQINLLDSTGQVVARSDDWAGFDAERSITDFIAPASGTYYVQVIADTGQQYTLTVSQKARLRVNPDNLNSRNQDITQAHNAIGRLDAFNTQRYELRVKAGDVINASIVARVLGEGAAQNDLIPAIELRDSNDAVLVKDQNPSNQSNASITYNATADATLSIVIYSIGGSGDYDLAVTGSTAGAAPMFVSGHSPNDGDSILYQPFVFLDFSQPILFSSVDASDFLVDGVPATSVYQIDGNTVAFFSDQFKIDGDHTVSVVNGSVLSTTGAATSAFSMTFHVDSQGPKVTTSTIAPDQTFVPGTVDWSMDFSEPVMTFYSAGIFGFIVLDPSDIQLTNLSTGQTFNTNRFQGSRADPNDYDTIDHLTVGWDNLPEGRYEARLLSNGNGFMDRYFHLLDGSPSFPLPSGDGSPGGDFVLDFNIDRSGVASFGPLRAVRPFGTNVYEASVSGSLHDDADTDTYSISLSAGQKLSVMFHADHGDAVAQIDVLDPNGNTIGTATTAAGASALIQSLNTPSGGTYQVRITNLSGIGGYTLRAWVGAAGEQEPIGGATNDDSSSAQSLDGGFGSLLNIQSSSVVGEVLGGDVDYYGLALSAGQVMSALLGGIGTTSGLKVELYDANGTLLATGAGNSLNADSAIHDFVAPAAGQYFLKVSGTGRYNLTAVRDGSAEHENNSTPDTATDISLTHRALGHLSSGQLPSVIRVAETESDFPATGGTNNPLALIQQLNDDTFYNFNATQVKISQIDTLDELNNYDVVILDDGTMTTPGFASTLRTWVSQGHGIIATGPIAERVRLSGTVDPDWEWLLPIIAKNSDTSSYGTWTLNNATHPIVAGLSNFDEPYADYAPLGGADADATVLATLNGRPVAVSKDNMGLHGRSVFLGEQYGADFSIPGLRTGADDQLLEQAVAWAALAGDPEDNYTFTAAVGDHLTISTATPSDTALPPANLPDLVLDLYDPDGLLVAHDDNSSADGRNALIDFTTTKAGAYRVSVHLAGSNGGAYALEVQGATGSVTAGAPHVVSSTPGDGTPVAAAPTSIDLVLSDAVRSDSISASDLTLDTGTVDSFQIIDGRTIRFFVTIPDVEGNYNWSIAAGAFTSLQGTPSAAGAGSFSVDHTGPRVVSQQPAAQASAPFNSWQITFSEDIDPASIDVNDLDLRLPNNSNINYLIQNVAVAGNVVTITFQNQLASGDYTLRVGPNITDVVGNKMDQDQDGTNGESGQDVYLGTVNVASPNLQVQSIVTPAGGTLGSTIDVSWTVKNVGADPALGNWSDRVFLSADTAVGPGDTQLGVFAAGTAPLGAGASYTTTKTFTLPLTPTIPGGTYYIIVVTDTQNTQPEADESDNTGVSSGMNLQPPPLPDLAVTSITAPSSAVSGNSMLVHWDLSNVGSLDFTGNIVEEIYLSTDTSIGGDTLVGTVSFSGSVSAGGVVHRQASVNIPINIQGARYVVVKTDTTNVVYEHTNEANNNAIDDQSVNVTLAPIPDLFVSSITAPASEYSGRNVQVQWVLQNNGTGDLNGTFYDRLWMSSDATLDGNDKFYGDFEFTGTIPAGTSITRTQTVTLPNDYQGPAYFFVQTDVFNNFFEDVGESNNTSVSASPMNVILSPFPNLVVDSVLAPTTAFTNQTIQLDWYVHNIGNGATNASQWWDSVYLSTDPNFDGSDTLLTQIPNTSYLNAGDSYHASTTLTLPREIEGPYYLIVYTDRYNSVYELNRDDDNTTASDVVHIDLTPPPDLKVTSVRPPTDMFSGQVATVRWTVKNDGLGTMPATQNQWWDRIWISQDNSVSNDDAQLASIAHNGILTPGQTYDGSATVKLPVGIQGPYYIIVRTDAFDQVFEQAFDTNNDTPDAVNVILTPPPDLNTTILNIPAPVMSSHYVNVSVRVDNDGATEAPDTQQWWLDRLYLSTDDTFDPNTDVKIGETQHGGGLGVGGSYTTTIQGLVPDGYEGQYYLYVAADADNQLFELDNSNNIVNQQINVLKVSPDLIVSSINSPANVDAGSLVNLGWTVTDNSDGDTGWRTDWNDRLYLSADSIPGNGDDIFLDEVNHNGLVNAHGSYTVTKPELIPFYAATGDYYLFAYTDWNGHVYEDANEGNNWSAPKPIHITRNTPDLQITSANFGTPLSGKPLATTYTVSNTGGGPTNESLWNDQFYLSVDPVLGGLTDYYLGTYQHVNPVGAGQSYTRTVSPKLPQDVTGDFYLIIQTDAHNQAIEGDETNNLKVIPIHVSLGPVPDLKVTAIDAPTDANASQPITINWTVTNQGDDPTETNGYQDWYDAVYLSTDKIFDVNSDIALGYRYHVGSLGIGQSYSQTLTGNVPPGLSGPYYAFVVTDRGNNIYERSGELNNATFDTVPVQVHLLPPADLVAGSLVVPANSRPGQTVDITYTVSNNSTEPAVGTWIDSLYLSSDDTWDLGDTLIGKVTHTGDVAPGGQYTATLNARLPGVISGDYKVILRSDIRNQVPEDNEANNFGASIDKVAMTVPALTLGVPTSDLLEPAQGLYYRVDVTAGETMLVTLDSDSTTAANELYIRYGQVPTRANFDVGYDKPLESDQRVVVELTKPGSYYILAYAATAGANQNIQIEARTIQYSVIDSDFGKGGNVGNRTIQINGAKFDRTVTATVLVPGGDDRDAIATYPVNTIRFYATFDLKGLAPGQYDIRVTKADGSSVVVPNSLQVVNGGAGSSKPVLYSPGFIGFGILFRINYAWGNDGYNDIPAPLFKVGADTKLGKVPSYDAEFDMNVATFLGVAIDDGPAGIIRPKETSAKAYFTISNFSRAPLNLWADRVQDDLSAPMNWDRVYGILPERDDLTPQQFAAAWDKFKQMTGKTWYDYLSMLSRAANVLPPSGGDPSLELDPLELAFSWAVAETNTSISGRVFHPDFKVPISDHKLIAKNLDTGDTFDVFTNKDGTFTLDHVTPGRYSFKYLGGIVDSSLVVKVNEGTHLKNLELDLTAGVNASGRVTAADNSPIEDAAVEFVDSNGESIDTTTDAAGNYLLEGLPPGTYDIYVRAAGKARIIQQGVDVSGTESINNFVMQTGAKIIGTVNATGAAVSGTIGVIVKPMGSTDRRSFFNGTIENNNFTIDQLPAGNYQVIVSRRGYISQVLNNVTVTTGGTVNLGTVTLQVMPNLTGVVKSTTSSVVPDAVIDLLDANDKIVATTTSDSTGAYVMPFVDAGTYTMRVDQPYYGLFTTSVTLGTADATKNVTLTPAGVLTGVLKINGKPAKNATLGLIRPDGRIDGAHTDADGNYTFIRLVPGVYTVMLEDGSNHHTFTVTNAALDVVQNFDVSAGSISGKVLLAAGSPADDASVAIFRNGQQVGTADTFVDGTYSFPALSPGTYSLVGYASGKYFSTVINVVVAAGSNTAAPNITQGTSSLSVTIKDASTLAPLTDAGRITVTRAQAIAGLAADPIIDVAAGGVVTLQNLAPGDYDITVLYDGLPSVVQRVTVGAGANSTDVLVGVAGSIQGTITAGGSPAKDITVLLYDPSAPYKEYRGNTADDGTFSWDAIPAGTYRMLILDNRTGISVLSRYQTIDGGLVTITEGGTVTRSFDMQVQSNGVSGLVSSPSGDHPYLSQVQALNADGVVLGSSLVAADGQFAIAGLIPGTYTLKLISSSFFASPVSVGVSAGQYATDVAINATWSMGASPTISVATVAAPFGNPFTAAANAIDGMNNWIANTFNGFDFSGSWVFNNQVASGLRNILSKILGEPKRPANLLRPDKLFEMLKKCPEVYARALKHWQDALKYERIMFEKFDNYHAQWEAWVQIGSANIGLVGTALLKFAGAMYAFRGPVNTPAAWEGSYAAARQEMLAQTRLVGTAASRAAAAQRVELMDRAAEAMRQMAASNAGNIQRLGDFVGTLVGSLGVPDTVRSIGSFLDKITGSPSSVTFSDLVGFSSSVASLGASITQALAVFSLLADTPFGKYLGPVSEALGTLSAICQTWTDNTADLQRIAEAKKEFDKYLELRNEAYRKVLLCIAKCDKDDDYDEDDARRDYLRAIARPNAYDPNEIVGPQGFGDQRFVQGSKPLNYIIRFDNDPTVATTPVSKVRVTTRLDPDTDFRSFRLGDFGFGDITVDVPDNVAFYQTEIDLTASRGIYVQVVAGIDVSSGEAFWEFTSIDPETGDLVTNPLNGFLPVNTDGHEGLGFVEYSAKAKSTAQTGDVIDAQASIFFDINPPVDTNVESNTLDEVAPTSQIDSVTQFNANQMLVKWSGLDDENGSGVANYDIWVSRDGGVYELWLDGTTDTQAVYTGTPGVTYSFYSVARDNAGNAEDSPNTADSQYLVSAAFNNTPTLSIGTDVGLTEGDNFTRDGSFEDLDADQTWSGTVDYGDGTGAQPLTLNGKNFTLNHVYADNGVYTVTVSVTDSLGAIGGGSFTATVANAAPQVGVNAGSASEGSPFNLLAAFSDAGSGDTHTATVDFGDGSAVVSGTVNEVLKTIAAGHTYADNGSYTVTVSVTDDDGASNSSSATVTVSNVAPSMSGVTIDSNIDEGSGATLSGQMSDPSTKDTFTLSVDWGDGSTVENFPHPAGSTDFTHPHTYVNSGQYTVTITLTDDDGGSSTLTKSVTVNNVAPTATFASGGAVTTGSPASVSFSNISDPSPGDVSAGFVYAYDFDNDGTFEEVSDEPSATHVFTRPGTYTVKGRITDQNGGATVYSTTITVNAAQVVGRHIFYNNSAFDGESSAANAADDAAIATDKTALLPGGTATFANYTSYSKGINGIMFDITGTPGSLSASDFTFKIGNTNDPGTWVTAPPPTSITVRPGDGAGGSNRVTLTWADNAIQKQWLQITVKANDHTGLASADVFYFGNAIGESGNLASNTIVNATDQILARNNQTLSAGITNAYDFNRDGIVNSADEIVARFNGTTVVNGLKLISIPAPVVAPVSTPVRAPTRTPRRTATSATSAVTTSASPSPVFSTSPIVKDVPSVADTLLKGGVVAG
jgi:methionine-rich copper-binding protein CopC